MSPSKRTTLRLAVDLASEPIEGEVQAPTGPAHPFVGWLGLAAALEHAMERDGTAPITTIEEDPHVP